MIRVRLITVLIVVLGTGALSLPATASASDNTATAVSCSPSTVTTGGQTACKATVSDTTASANTPTGTVDFSASPGGSIGSCTLDATRSCHVNFTPTAGGDYTVSASYEGTGSFQPSSGTTSVTAVDPTTLTVSCSPSTVPLNSPTECTATLTDPKGGPPPIGAVTFGSSPTAGNFGPPACQSAPGSATCRVTFTPSTAGGYTVTAAYDPCPSSGIGGCDTHHAKSSASTRITATRTPAGGGPGSHGGGSGSLTIPVTNGPPPPGTVKIAPRAKVSKRHFARLQLSCLGGAGSSCTGTVVLTTQIKVKVKVKVLVVSRKGSKKHHGKHKTKTKTKLKTEKKTILVGMVNYGFRAGTSSVLSIKLKKAGVKALGRHRRLRVSAAAGSAARTVTLLGPKHKKKHHKKKHRHHHRKK